MKYRIKAISFKVSKKPPKNPKAKYRNIFCPSVIPPVLQKNRESIDFNLLFEIGELPNPKKIPLKLKAVYLFKVIFSKIKKLSAAVGRLLIRAVTALFGRIRDKNRRLAFYSGLLCSALLVASVSLVTVLIGLFGKYLLPYEKLTIPSFVGKSFAELESAEGGNYELVISYKNSDTVPAGTVISQAPDEGVTRKLYKNGEPCTISLTVSSGKSFYTVDSLVGVDLRTALLKLKNNDIATKIVYEYSSEISGGTIISTSPSEGKKLYDGEILTLKISRGKEIKTASVPDLYGLNESAARSLLEERGLLLGTITYTRSSTPQGKIISQQYSPYTSIEEGSTVDITVSLGNTVTEKRVPELYGLTVSEAEKRLAEVGLVVGGIYSVSSGAPSGTVIAQTPVAGTPITSSVNYVDLYISA